MELKAKFKKQLDVVVKSDFKSRKVWVTTEDNPDYPQTIEVEVHKDKVDMFNNISEGAPVTLHINLRGRTWTGTDGIEKVFNSLVCWKVEADSNAVPYAPAVANNVADCPPPKLEDTGSLPF